MGARIQLRALHLIRQGPVSECKGNVMGADNADIAYDYDGRTFRSVSNTANGQVSEETTFTYRQDGDIVWAEYSGGEILTGHLLGTVAADGSIEFSYHHVSSDGTTMAGWCTSTPEVLEDGRIRLHERWQWTTGDRSSGESVVEEDAAEPGSR